VSGEFLFRNTATGTRITIKSMVDYNATQKLLNEQNLHFFKFYDTNADKPVKAVIRHLPGNTSAEDIIVDLQDVISVKQMTAKRPTPEGGVTHLPPHLPSSASKKLKSSRNIQTDNTLQYSYKGCSS
jgi:hypothetical protein